MFGRPEGKILLPKSLPKLEPKFMDDITDMWFMRFDIAKRTEVRQERAE
jgi:hypothetical protein